ncbi:MAG TPA: hydrolase 1, exosortase A system-associated [Steroidobacteraceae bacterium]|nr:hydrolase 1, exosortase A system-associated [Steroidobacteraceae bacterium]
MSGEAPLLIRSGSDSMVGVLHPALQGAANVGVLVVVGGPQYRVGSHRQFVLMARQLAKAGFPVLRFDYRGMGDSDGEVRTFEGCGEDIRAALEAFQSAIPTLKGVVVWGLCDAASAALMHVTQDSRVLGIVLVNPWVRTVAGEARAYVQHYYGQRLLQASFWRKLLSGKLDVMRSVRDFVRALGESRGAGAAARAPISFIERMRRGLTAFARPVLVLISERDLTAAEFTTLCTGSDAWRQAMGRSSVQLVRLAGADHTFSSRSSLDEATSHCIAWLTARIVMQEQTTTSKNGRAA